MKKSKFSEEQTAYVLRQVESGTPPADACRQMGVSEATFYIWKKKFIRDDDIAGGECGDQDPLDVFYYGPAPRRQPGG